MAMGAASLPTPTNRLDLMVRSQCKPGGHALKRQLMALDNGPVLIRSRAARLGHRRSCLRTGYGPGAGDLRRVYDEDHCGRGHFVLDWT